MLVGLLNQNMIDIKSHLFTGNTLRVSNLSSFVPRKNVLLQLPSKFETLIVLDSSVEKLIMISRKNTPRDHTQTLNNNAMHQMKAGTKTKRKPSFRLRNFLKV